MKPTPNVLRRQLGMKASDLALHAGISPMTWNRIRNGHAVSVEIANRVLAVLNRAGERAGWEKPYMLDDVDFPVLDGYRRRFLLDAKAIPDELLLPLQQAHAEFHYRGDGLIELVLPDEIHRVAFQPRIAHYLVELPGGVKLYEQYDRQTSVSTFTLAENPDPLDVVE